MPWHDVSPQAPLKHTPQAFLTPLSSSDLKPTLGMVSKRARDLMVRRLELAGIQSPVVLAAMRDVPRHEFVDSAFASRAYDDAALPIGFKQTISQPLVVARMLELACGASVSNGAWLEIGTGCGYQAAVMAQCTPQVCSVERVAGLAGVAKKHLAQYSIKNVALLHGDGTQPWCSQYVSNHGKHAYERFDAIVVAAAGLGTPQAWLDQLHIGGRLIAPVQDEQGVQRLHLIERRSDTQFDRHFLERVQFVPLLGGMAHG
jgi:protein-L-isoaspartate(D-aspartate) O-methyltransferase